MNHDIPGQNIVHVPFMFHAIIIDLHALHNMHVVVVMLMDIHVSCIMHEFRSFPCMLHVHYMITNINTTCMLWETKT